MKLLSLAALAAALLLSCTPAPQAVRGNLDLSPYDWKDGPVVLRGEWTLDDSYAPVPGTWNGPGTGTYRLVIGLPAGSPPLAVRYGTASTAFSLRANGEELVRVGNPSSDPLLARPAFAPGTVRVPAGPVLELEIFVSNHEYRVGGLWRAPVLGPAQALEADRWAAESASLALATTLAVIGFASLLLYLLRRTEHTFQYLAAFALTVAVRALVSGEYALTKVFPTLPFDWLIRIEYLTAYTALPAAALFFGSFFPGLWGRGGARLILYPSLGFCALTLFLPLNWLTQTLLFYYPVAIATLAAVVVLATRRVFQVRQGYWFLFGVGLISLSGGADMFSAALYSQTGSLLPWGLGLLVVLQATALARRVLRTLERTELLLAEKELLVKEVHHRVKNSLQVVASLVSLQGNRLEDPAQKAIFQALRQRITSVALVHEKLYGQGNAGRPDVGEYLKDLLRLQYPADSLGSGKISWDVKADPLSAGVDYCVDAGLILTELVGNAHKHGLLPRGGGSLEIAIRIRENRLVIEVTDDGPGFAPDFRPEASKGLGFRLVLALLQRNEGSLEIAPGPGGRVQVELRLPTAV